MLAVIKKEEPERGMFRLIDSPTLHIKRYKNCSAGFGRRKALPSERRKLLLSVLHASQEKVWCWPAEVAAGGARSAPQMEATILENARPKTTGMVIGASSPFTTKVMSGVAGQAPRSAKQTAKRQQKRQFRKAVFHQSPLQPAATASIVAQSSFRQNEHSTNRQSGFL